MIKARTNKKAGVRIASSKKTKQKKTNGLHLSCDFHKLGANLCSKLPVAPDSCKKVWHWRKEGWIGCWMDGIAGLRIADSNQKSYQPQ